MRARALGGAAVVALTTEWLWSRGSAALDDGGAQPLPCGNASAGDVQLLTAAVLRISALSAPAPPAPHQLATDDSSQIIVKGEAYTKLEKLGSGNSQLWSVRDSHNAELVLKQCADGTLPGHVEPVSGPPRAGNGPQRAAAAGPSPSIGGGGSGFRPRNRAPNRGTARWGAIRAGESMAGSLPPGTERIDFRDL